MSNRDEIEKLVVQGRLCEITQRDLRAGDRGYRRWIYVSSELNEEITARFDEPAFRRLSAQLQNFILGGTVPVALVPNHKKAQWARLAGQSGSLGNSCSTCIAGTQDPWSFCGNRHLCGVEFVRRLGVEGAAKVGCGEGALSA